MKSLWLCVDPVYPIDLNKHSHMSISGASHNCNIPSSNTPYYGIYKDHPMSIGKRIKRPSTPFFNSTNSLKNSGQCFNESSKQFQSGINSLVCASPLFNEKFEINHDERFAINGVSIF